MRQRRLVIAVAFAALVLSGIALIVTAHGDSFICDESITASLPASSYDISVISASEIKSIKLAFGDLEGRCVPRPIMAALSYAIQWVKSGPRPVEGDPAVLGLPASQFALVAQVLPDRATVTIKKATVKKESGTRTGLLNVELIRVDGVWKVVAVTMP